MGKQTPKLATAGSMVIDIRVQQLLNGIYHGAKSYLFVDDDEFKTCDKK